MTEFDYGRTINGNDTFRVQQSVSPAVPRFDGGNLSETARGLLANGGGGAATVQGGGANAQATTRSVGRDELVENRLAGLLNQQNPYIDRARRAASDQAASRGLSNSSIAAGNAEGAAIDRAMPIATQDATTYGRTAAENMAAQNAMTQANLQANTGITQSRISAAASRGNANASLQAAILGNENRLVMQDRDAQIAAYTDARRQMYNIENRESGDNYRFDNDLDFRYYNTDRDYDERARQFDNQLMFNNRQLDTQSQLQARGQDFNLIGQRATAQSNAVGAVASNPNMESEQQRAAMDQASQITGGFFEQAMNLPPFQLPPLPSFNFDY